MKKEQNSILLKNYTQIVTECKSRRNKCKFSQDRMAELLKVSKGKINSLETFKVTDFLFLETYCNFFGMDLSMYSSKIETVRNYIFND